MAALALVPLPGLQLGMLRGVSVDRQVFGVLALGLAPAVSAFVLVETVAALVPRWRYVRQNGQAGRLRLNSVTYKVTLIVAAIQSFGLAVYSQDVGLVSAGPAPRAVLVGTLVLGTCLVLGAIHLMSRFGFTNGVGIAMVTLALFDIVSGYRSYLGQGPTEVDFSGLLIPMLTVGGFAFALVRRRHEDSADGQVRVQLRLPLLLSGILPLWIVARLPLLLDFGPGANFGRTYQELTQRLEARLLIMVPVVMALGLVLGWVFNRAGRVTSVWRPLGFGEDLSKQFGRGIARTLLFLVLAVLLHTLAFHEFISPVVLDLPLIFVVVAVLVDIHAEHKALRMYGKLRAAFPLSLPYAADACRFALAKAGIPCFLRDRSFNGLWGFFAPFSPIMVMVPENRVEEASDVLTQVLRGDKPQGLPGAATGPGCRVQSAALARPSEDASTEGSSQSAVQRVPSVVRAGPESGTAAEDVLGELPPEDT